MPLEAAFVYNAAAFDDGLVLNALVPTSEAMGRPLHRLAADGSIRQTLGQKEASIGLGGMALHRRLAPALAGGFWSAPKLRYRIDRYDSAGRLVRRVTRSAEWFGGESEVVPGGDRPPDPVLLGVRETGPDTLLVLVSVPKRDYLERRGPPIGRSRRGNPLYDVSRKQDLRDTMVEVIDVANGRLVSSQRVPLYLVGFADDRRAVSYRVDERGTPFVDIVELRFLTGGPP
jgi:hypothetical protein